MISDEEIKRAMEEGKRHKPVILSCKYDPENDRVEFTTAWCVIAVDRKCIDELRDVPPALMNKIYISQFGVHLDEADIDINSAGLITFIGKQLETEAAGSF